MISKPSASDCFVYITLPGEVSAVTAGRFVLKKNARGDAVGQFVYRGKYLDDPQAVEIDPVELKLSARTYETARLNGVFGALRDAGPDYWGRRVIEKHAGKALLGELDYLLESPDDRAGALGFGLNNVPPAPRRKFNKTLDLEKLQALADALVRDDLPNDPEARQIQELLLLGTSMGGARPKAVVQDDDGLCGSQNSVAQMTAGTIRGSSTPCCGSPTSVESRRRRAVWKRWVAGMCCSSSASIVKRRPRATRAHAWSAV
jgi:serine/threonine-protein kinase HipA